MTTYPRLRRLPRLARWGLFLLLLVSIPATRLQAAEPVSMPRIGISASMLNWRTAERLLGNRQAMLQFGAIGMIFGLWILMKK